MKKIKFSMTSVLLVGFGIILFCCFIGKTIADCYLWRPGPRQQKCWDVTVVTCAGGSVGEVGWPCGTWVEKGPEWGFSWPQVSSVELGHDYLSIDMRCTKTGPCITALGENDQYVCIRDTITDYEYYELIIPDDSTLCWSPPMNFASRVYHNLNQKPWANALRLVSGNALVSGSPRLTNDAIASR
jgi:hypothetical protein